MAKSGPDRKRREEAEAGLVSAYLQQYYPDDLTMTHVRLGAIQSELPPGTLTDSELALAGQFRRWADALVVRQYELVLIEGAIRPALGDISILMGYALLLKVTPELVRYRDLPLRIELVAAIEDPVVSMMAYQQGINFVLFTTPEVDDYISRQLPRFRRAPQDGGILESTEEV
jgi:hypothetical protein